MAIEPLRGRCRECGREVLLAELVLTGTSACPACGAILAPGYGAVLVEEARRAEALQREFLRCLQRLSELPGALELDRAAVFRNALARIGWDETADDERVQLDAEAGTLRREVRAWALQPLGRRRQAATQLAGRLRRLAQRVRLHAARREVGDPSAGLPVAALWQTADELERCAAAVLADRRRADLDTRAALAVLRERLHAAVGGGRAGAIPGERGQPAAGPARAA